MQIIVEVDVSRRAAVPGEQIGGFTAVLRAVIDDMKNRLPDQAGAGCPAGGLVGIGGIERLMVKTLAKRKPALAFRRPGSPQCRHIGIILIDQIRRHLQLLDNLTPTNFGIQGMHEGTAQAAPAGVWVNPGNKLGRGNLTGGIQNDVPGPVVVTD